MFTLNDTLNSDVRCVTKIVIFRSEQAATRNFPNLKSAPKTLHCKSIFKPHKMLILAGFVNVSLEIKPTASQQKIIYSKNMSK